MPASPRILAPIAALALLSSATSAADFDGDLGAFDGVYQERFGKHVSASMRPVALSFGQRRNGLLYAYDKVTDEEDGSYVEYYEGNERIVLSAEETDKLVKTYIPYAFNVTYLKSECIVLIYRRKNITTGGISYYGKVFCLKNSVPFEVKALSRALDYRRDADEARKALEPLLK